MTHPQRCETYPYQSEFRCENGCKFLEKDPVDWGFDPYCHGFGNHVQGAKINLQIWEWVKRYGCASHSSAEQQEWQKASLKDIEKFNEQEIRHDEREKVLHDIQHVIAEYCGDGIHKGWVLAYPLDIWIAKELRSKQGELNEPL